jgi:hypothetical protein
MRYLAMCLAIGLAACGGAGNEPRQQAPVEIPDGLVRADFNDTAEAAVAELQGLSEEFSVVELAARTQDEFEMDEGAVFIVQAFDHTRALRVDERFDLEPVSAPGSAMLSEHDAPGFAMQAFALSEEDTQRILAVRQTLADMKAATPGENQLALNAIVTGCLKDPDEKPEDLKLSVFLKIRPDSDFFPFFSEQVLPASGPAYATSFWTPCEEKRDS